MGDKESLQQNEQFSICLKPEVDYIQITKVSNFTMSQGTKAFTFVQNGKSINTKLATIQIDSPKAIVNAFALTQFFLGEHPSYISITGNVLLGYKRRRLAAGESLSS